MLLLVFPNKDVVPVLLVEPNSPPEVLVLVLDPKPKVLVLLAVDVAVPNKPPVVAAPPAAPVFLPAR